MPLLEVEHVSVQFGGVNAVDDASFSVDEAEVVGLIGPNGAGKTTTFNVVSGLQRPTAGVVRFDGTPISGLSVQERARRGISRTFQRLEVFGSLSVRENVLVAAEIHASWSDGPSAPAATTAALLDRIGLAPFAEQRADAVPTGVARLTELARALATDPRLLLLDEPSSGLSDEETDELAHLLRDLARREGRSVLLVEHDVDLVMQVCDRIHVLHFGRVIASGPPHVIQESPEVQAAYLGLQEAVAP